jgi:type I restriction enzyme, S subunit
MEVKPGYKQTEVGLIPEDWGLPLLDSIAKRGSGHTPDKKHPEYWDGPIKWVSLRDSDSLDKIFIEETAATITLAGIANSSAVLHPAGTVVLSRDAGVGKSAIMKTEMAVSQHFMAWQCGATLDNIYLYYWLQGAKPEFERIAMGNTIKTIGLPFFRNYRIAHPPVTEQRAIAAALSNVDALLAKLDQFIAKNRDLKQAAMQQLLTGQTRLPGFSSAWELKRLGDVAEVSKGSQLHSDDTSAESDFPHYNGGISPSSYTQKANAPADTIAISEGGNSCGYVQLITRPFWCGGHCYAVVPKGIDRRFLYHALKGRQQTIMGLRVGSGLPNVQKTALKAFSFEFPKTAEEQTAIAAVLSDMDADIAALEARRDKTRDLKQGMMQELLTGKIRLV